MTRAKWGFAAALLVLVVVVAVASAQSVLASLDGVYTYVGGSAEKASIEQAIATATSQLPARSRVRWRAQLEEMVRPAPRLVMRRSGAEFAVSTGSNVELRSATDGSRVASEGDWELEQRVVNGALEQRIEKGSIAQRYSYALGRDQRSLTISVSIRVPELRQAVAYRLSYRKQ